jgi:hypothetical protein
MRYMVLLKMAEDVGAPPAELVEAMGDAMQQAFASGVMLDAGGLAPTAESTEVSLRRGSVLITDGPYAEAKEVAGGYAILESRSHEEAVENARRMMAIHQQHWPGWEGVAEVRRISGPENGTPSG